MNGHPCHLESFEKHSRLGLPPGFDSGGLGGAQERAFPTSSQVTLVLLLWGPHCGRHWTRSGSWWGLAKGKHRQQVGQRERWAIKHFSFCSLGGSPGTRFSHVSLGPGRLSLLSSLAWT